MSIIFVSKETHDLVKLISSSLGRTMADLSEEWVRTCAEQEREKAEAVLSDRLAKLDQDLEKQKERQSEKARRKKKAEEEEQERIEREEEERKPPVKSFEERLHDLDILISRKRARIRLMTCYRDKNPAQRIRNAQIAADAQRELDDLLAERMELTGATEEGQSVETGETSETDGTAA